MIELLIVVLSVPGLALWRALVRQPPLARELPIEPDDTDVVRFGFDSAGLVD